mmetsp:Transcript_22412/g.38168  ORF Transcript_22412/g.38168 Transcript_22412/m.38168 type:complete len:219 (-) Transcript_22412:1047-1703(-)
MPSVKGHTSTRISEFMWLSRTPLSTAPCTAAPYATASSGLTDLHSCFPPKYSCNRSWTFGMRVEPPTSTTWSTFSLPTFASSNTRFTDARQRSNSVAFNFSKVARLMLELYSSPEIVTSMSAVTAEDSKRLARSHALRSCRQARGLSLMRSLPEFCFLNTLIMWSCIAASKSSPPKCVSPAVASTLNTPSSICSNDTSNVPPPKSKTSTSPSLCLSRP